MSCNKTHLLEHLKPAYQTYTEIHRMDNSLVTSEDGDLYVIPNDIVASIGEVPTLDEFTDYVEHGAKNPRVSAKISHIVDQLAQIGIETELLYTTVFRKDIKTLPLFATRTKLVKLTPAGEKLRNLVETR